MSYFGNDTFGYNMQLAAHASSHGSGFGRGFGQGSSVGFGNKTGFGQGMGSGGFGNSSMTDPHSVYLNAHSNPEYMQSLAQHGLYVRQNSLMSEMTKSKTERTKSPSAMSTFTGSYPSSGQNDNGMLNFSLFDKPGENTNKRPKLQRQNTFSVADSLERPGMMEKRRAPSFSSDPERMRGKTISSSSMPSQRPAIPKLSRSISINEDLTTPANMDIAGPMLRRQRSIDIEKSNKRRPLQRRSSLLSNLHLGKRKKATRSVSDESGVNSETSSSHLATRSRSNTNESRSSTAVRSRSNTAESRSSAVVRSRSNTAESRSSAADSVLTPGKHDRENHEHDNAHEKLILSLMNPDPSDQHDSLVVPSYHKDFQPESPSYHKDFQPESPSYHKDFQPESPTLVSRKVHQLQRQDKDDASEKSHRSKRSKESSKTSDKPKSPATSHALLVPNTNNLHPDHTDSDVSEIYYDCNQSKQNSPSSIESGSLSKTKSRISRPESSAGTWTDGEDTTSTCETPPRKSIPEPEALMTRDKGLIPGQGRDENQSGPKQRPTLKRLAHQHGFMETEEPEVQEGLMKPVYASIVHDEPEQHHESGTAESSESGYATTSHKPLSPKDYHLKVSQFVNSLPNNPDIDERLSETEHGALNGSLTDIDMEPGHDITFYPDKNLTNVVCASGSDTENESDGDISTSKLEVMKLLESPKDVTARVLGEIDRKKTGEEYDGNLPGPTYLSRKESSASQTEVLKLVNNEPSEEIHDKLNKPNEKHVELNGVIKVAESPKEHNSDGREMNRARRPITSTSGNIFSYGRQFSTIYQSNSTNCVDLILHLLNFVLFLSSSGVIGLGIWLLLKDFNVNDVTIILGNNLLQVIIYVAIAGAGLTLLAAFCLCCGVRQDKVGLGFYAIILVTVVIGFGTAAILSTIFADKLQGIEFRFNFKLRLEEKYGDDGNVESKLLTSAWDVMQSEFECCGGEGNENGTESWALYRKSTWFRNNIDKGLEFVPESCCKKNTNIDTCQGRDHDLLGPPRYAPPLNKYYPQRNPNLHTNGCYNFFSSYLNKLSSCIAIVTGSLAGLYLLTVMLTWVFCFKKHEDNKDSSYYDESYDYDDHDDVFSDNQRVRDIEETTFISNTPSSMKKKTKIETITESAKVPSRESHNSDTSESDDSDSEEEEDREEETSHTSSHEEVIARRNLWLNSGSTVGHLLSTAIEEEDSDLEDSDEESQSSVAYV